MKRYLLFPAILALSVPAMAGTKTIITQTPTGKILNVEKVETSPPPAFMGFEEADTNSDGRIDRGEARNAGIMGFQKADRDGSGYLNQAEYESAATMPDYPAAEQ